MTLLLRLAANTLWDLSCQPESRAFHKATHAVAQTQRCLLLQTLARNAQTEFGRKHEFASIGSITEFQERVPLSTYDDYDEAVKRVAGGEQNVLTHDPVVLLEPTGGSTAATKLVFYTKTLKQEFNRALAPWIADLLRHEKGLRCGQAYWSVSPVTRHNERTPGGIPIGFEDDSEYLGGFQRHLARSILAVPPLVRHISDMASFRYVTLLFLLRSRSLALISVWNPTFLILLMDSLAQWWQWLADDIEQGTLTPPVPLPGDLQKQLGTLQRPDRARAGEVRAAFTKVEADTSRGTIHARLWPGLRLVSCWADAAAAPYISTLAGLFPTAHLQPKGLIATEGFVSFPLWGCDGVALAIRSHFWEFLPVAEDVVKQDGAPLLAHQLEAGHSYSIVMTTGGGLYRYRLHDRVHVTGYLHECPLLRFEGKEDHIADWFGEKLHEGHVRRALEKVLAFIGVDPTFAMLALEEQSTPSYTLFVEAPAGDEALQQVSAALEMELRTNYHYDYCRDLGQLGALRVFHIENGAAAAYIAACQVQGQRTGDIKPVALHRRSGWTGVFRGRFVDDNHGR